ncbi:MULTISPECIES: peptidoglycan DD-metalloendopeptidase family protein [unclassified Serratia (in: enterobacteria)]|uniref:peptidoglycan DD-metalloendopeptidase family protein n=1 Tax=unclassified Serratia (in: enterobacteria) TaxID=2647522 RepID=UPI003FA6B17B
MELKPRISLSKKYLLGALCSLSLAACTSTNPPPSETQSTTPDLTPVTFQFWPAEGPLISSFSDEKNANKGIDIQGKTGQPIIAAAKGTVVYAGDTLRGYGKLIVIKHNDELLSAYAHNDTLLVHEQQEVQAGQQIATMGSSDAVSTRLHFEIRYKGPAVDPIPYLPAKFLNPIKNADKKTFQ